MAVPMIMYRCTECRKGVRREANSGEPNKNGCTASRDKMHRWIIESRSK